MAVSDSDFQRVKEKVEVLNGDRRQAMDKRAFRYGEVRDIQEFIAKLRSGAEELGDKIEAIAEDAQELRAKVTRLDGDVEDLKQDTSVLRERIDQANADINELQGRISNARADIDAIVNNTSTVQADLQRIRSRIVTIAIPGQGSGNVSAPPTAGQFNSMVDDVGKIFTVLNKIKDAFG